MPDPKLSPICEDYLVTIEYTETVTRSATVRVPAGVDLCDRQVLNDITEQFENIAGEADSGLDSEITIHGPESSILTGAVGSIDGDYEPDDES